MKIEIQNIFLLLGLLQALILSISSLSSKTRSTRYFGLLILLIGVFVFNNLIFYYSGNSAGVQLRDFFFWEPLMLWGPLVFFYAKSLFEKEFKITRKYFAHFLPSLLDLFPPLLSACLGFMSKETFYSSNEETWLQILDTYDTYIVVPGFLSISFYLMLSWRYLLANRKVADSETYKWFREVLIAKSLIVVIWFPFLILYTSPIQQQLLQKVYFYPVFYPIVAFVYYISIRSLRKLSFRPNFLPAEELKEKADHLYSAVLENRLYLHPNLNLNRLSEMTGLPASQISFILNHHFDKGFNQFINEIRIREALKRIQENGANQLTIEGIGYEVGFSSRSTFYRAFKQVTGKNPNAYIS